MTGYEMTEKQNAAVEALVKKGWRVNLDDGETVFMSKRSRKVRGLTIYRQVEADGTVEGAQEEE